MRLLLYKLVPILVLTAGLLMLLGSLFMRIEVPSAAIVDVPGAAEPEFTSLERQPGGAGNYDLSFVLELPDTFSKMLLVTSHPNGIFMEIGYQRARIGRLLAGRRMNEVGSNLRASNHHEALLKRRGGRFFLIVDGVLAGAIAEDFVPPEDFAVSGRVAMKNVNLSLLKETILFGDDFMREMNERSPWENISGRWEVVGLKNPSLSANPFRLSTIGADATTVTGRTTWDEYRATTSVMGAKSQSIGLVFCHRGPEDYFLFRCHAADADKQAEIIRYRAGGYSLLATAPVRYEPGIWHKLDLFCSHGRTRILVDENQVFDVEDPCMTGGRFGLYASGIERSWFDDVVVGPWLEVSYTGKACDGLFQPLCGAWETGDGEVEMLRSAETLDGKRMPGLFVTAPFTGGVSASARLLEGAGGIALGVSDPLNFIALIADGRNLRIARYRNGTPQIVRELQSETNANIEMKFTVVRGLATAEAAGLRFSVPVDTDLRGAAGLVAVSPGTRFLLPVTASIPPRHEEIRTGNATFAFETSMASWADEMSDWARGESGSFWYRGFLPANAEINADLSHTQIPENGVLGMGLRKSGEGTKLNGYSLIVKRSTNPEGDAATESDQMRLTLELHREGTEVKKATAEVDSLHSASLRTANGAVVGELNGMPVVSWVDKQPELVNGYKAAYKASGMDLPPTSVVVSSPSIFNYLFETAPTDWRPVAGVWEVTNRWQCDQRWSFFSGMLNPKKEDGKLVLIWNKRRFSDPVRIDFFVAPKMQRERGNKYEYARDFNLSLTPDADHPLSGYSFLFGAFNNTKSAITRKGKVVASSTTGIIRRSMRIHRHWYHIVVTKEHGDINFTIDEGQMLDLKYTDPDPLPADRVCIWSFDCSIMISRVRISGAGGTIDEIPGTASSETPRTIYDLLSPKGEGKE